jgi:hypothetical protein
MTRNVYAIHGVDTDSGRYAEVRSYMIANGAPIIRIVDCTDYYVALEGSHRLAIAAELGLTPRFEILGQDDMVAADSLDWTESLDQSENYTAGDLAGEAYSTRSVDYQFDV